MSESSKHSDESLLLKGDGGPSNKAKEIWKKIMLRNLRKIAERKSAAGQERSSEDSSKKTTRKDILTVPNSPILLSRYDEKTRRLLQQNPTLTSNKVHVPWYRRYTDAIPDREQQHSYQPFREIQTRDEDIALQHQFGVHECMQDYVSRGMCKYPPMECKRIREMSMARYARIKKREEEKKEIREKKDRDVAPQDDTFVMPGQDIDLTTEFGFSANKKKLVCPVVDFLMKMHVNRERDIVRKSLSKKSKWLIFSTDRIRGKLQEAIEAYRKNAARNRIRRLFNLVLCVDRFIKCVAMIAGDTQTLLKDTTYRSLTRMPVIESKDLRGPEKEIAFFNVHNYQKVGQVQVPFHIQLILSKPWFTRSNKEVETAVRFLEKMRCFTAYPRQFQFMLARVAWYLELPTQKVVIRQSQQAVNFYLLLNGSVRIDRLEGSPCESESGYFKTLNTLSSQDMFGDECVTRPFSERWYTATTEEKCAALDFNMHDYNNMIQTANTSEEAPDHIRFLCKLRIMDNFPKIKLLREQDTNVTYFFFRPGTLVCHSVRESPYVFVIRNGSCSVLQEIPPKEPSKKSRGDLSKHSHISAKDFGSVANLSEPWGSKKSKDDRRSTSTRPRATSIFQDIKTRLSVDDKDWFEKTTKQFEMSKLGMKESIKTMKDKAEILTKTMSTDMLQKFNLADQPLVEAAVKSDEGLTTERLSRRSSLRWKLEGVPYPDVQDDSRPSACSASGSLTRRMSTSRRGSSARLSKISLGNEQRKSKIVGTNIPLTPERLVGESLAPSLIWSADTNNSAKEKDDPSGTSSVKLPDVFQAQMTGQTKKKRRGQAKTKKGGTLDQRGSRIGLDPPVSKYSQWSQKSVLTVTDVAGVEWLDYNDGNFKPPTDDTALVSHGATIIMIKKDFMLKYLRKVW